MAKWQGKSQTSIAQETPIAVLTQENSNTPRAVTVYADSPTSFTFNTLQ